MEHTSMKNEFGGKVEVKPIIIAPEFLPSDNYIYVSNIKPDEHLKSTFSHQGSEFQNHQSSSAVDTVDNIQRWTVSSSVILPINKTEDSINIEPADMPTGGVLLTDFFKNEDTEISGACELEQEHASQLAIIPSLITSPPEQSKSIHTDEKPYKCDICDREFSLAAGFHAHQQIHTGMRCCCDYCGKGRTTSTSLTRHRRIHTDEKPYKCDICKKEFAHSSDLKTHLRAHTGEKPYQCDICNKKFSHPRFLRTHQRIHTGEKPYTCDVCNKTFAASGNLCDHKRIHTGEKPYKCDVCNKEFTTSGTLSRHRRIHTGEKPYKCDVCNKEFNTSGTLSRHRRIHTFAKPQKCDA